MKVERGAYDFINTTIHLSEQEARIILSLLWHAYSESDLKDKAVGDMHTTLFNAMNANGELAALDNNDGEG